MSDADVIIIGGGAAGLIAAGAAARENRDVLLLEKMADTGRKLLLTGKGRCNITNIAPAQTFIQHFGRNGRFLQRPFAAFFSDDLLELLEQQGVDVVTERGGRVFPESGDARTVADALLRYALDAGVRILTRAEVTGIDAVDDRVTGVSVQRGNPPRMERMTAPCVILAAGGASYPGTGSNGDAYRLAAAAGHRIVPIRPALVPLVTSGSTAKELQGLSLRNVQLTLIVDGNIEGEAFGEMLFTHFGISGPIVLSLSKLAVDALAREAEVSIHIDLKPALDEERLDARLRRDLDSHGRQQMQTVLKGLLPRKLIPVCIALTQLDPEKPANQITGEERGRLRTWLKAFKLEVTGHHSFNHAIITAGGVDLREVDPGMMQSRLVSGLYFAGEVLDLDADTGGYNLQAAFTTGWVAGKAAAQAS